MHPARSLILFTTLSGLGFGFMAWLGLGLPRVAGWAAFGAYALAFGLAGGGLLASLFHLGHPERALKAFSQWRSSWLSREAWLACAALAVNGVVALMALGGMSVAPLGWLGAGLALATVAATSMIYASIRAVPRWHARTTPALFLALAITGGALLAAQREAALVLIVASAALQLYVWKAGDGRFAGSGTGIGSATGLGARGTVRAFEAPHTGGNYLTHEMIHVVGRKHAAKLRIIAVTLAFVAPVFFLILGAAPVAKLLAALFHALGVLVLRWLFFAEAEHVVGLYYGKRTDAA